MQGWHRVVETCYRGGKIVEVRCLDHRGRDEGTLTVEEVIERLAEGEEFLVAETVWSPIAKVGRPRMRDGKVVRLNGAYIRTRHDSCDHSNLENLPHYDCEEANAPAETPTPVAG